MHASMEARENRLAVLQNLLPIFLQPENRPMWLFQRPSDSIDDATNDESATGGIDLICSVGPLHEMGAAHTNEVAQSDQLSHSKTQ